jgi:hypothetical protein
MAYELHYYPGRFGDGVGGFVDRVVGGATALRLEKLTPALGPGAEAHRHASNDVAVAWLKDVPAGEARSAFAVFDRFGKRCDGSLSTCAAKDGRALIAMGFPGDGALAAPDAELGLLGAACATLAHESQGAALIGYDLGDPRRFGVEGTVAEQVRLALEALGNRVLVVLCAPDTGASLGELDGLYRKPFAGLVEYRRTSVG